MVIDDDESIRELYKIHLRKLGYNALLAKNGDEAVTLYQESVEIHKPVDVVILDLNIPGGPGGVDIASKLRAIGSRAKFIVSSGQTACPEMTQYKDFGFDGALEKNFKSADIKHLIDVIMKQS